MGAKMVPVRTRRALFAAATAAASAVGLRATTVCPTREKLGPSRVRSPVCHRAACAAAAASLVESCARMGARLVRQRSVLWALGWTDEPGLHRHRYPRSSVRAADPCRELREPLLPRRAFPPWIYGQERPCYFSCCRCCFYYQCQCRAVCLPCYYGEYYPGPVSVKWPTAASSRVIC